MSKRRKQNDAFWKDVEDSLRRIEVRYQGVPIAEEDARLIRSCYLLQAMVMTDLRIGRVSSLLSWKRWAMYMVTVDFQLVAVALKDLCRQVRNNVPGLSGSFSDFKHQNRQQYPFIGAFFAPIKDDAENFFASGDPLSFAVLNQHLNFMSHVNLRSVDFSEQMLEEYLGLERELTEQILPKPMVAEMNAIMKEWLRDLSWEEYTPRHGTGAVAFLGRAPLWQKYENLASDQLLEYATRGPVSCSLPEMRRGLDRSCEVRFVPKSALTWRTISMESATLQFLQQGYSAGLDSYFRRHKYLKTRIDFKDQERNRNLASVGSANRGQYSTIDLSSASDRVSWGLVKELFRGTALERPVWASRSRYAVLPDGRRIALHKYAPMGSALCFPVESLVFACVCELAIRNTGRMPRDSRYVVYGDDIIIEAFYARTVCDMLGDLGFKVNRDKTFIAQNIPFRESCGGEYYNGVDVSPFRISRKFSGVQVDRHHPEVVQAYVDLANEAYRRGLTSARSWFIHELSAKLPQNYLPIFSGETSGLHSDSATNFHLRTVRHENDDLKRTSFQCWMVRCGELTTKEVRPSKEKHEHIRLYEWLRQTRNRQLKPVSPETVVIANLSREIPL